MCALFGWLDVKGIVPHKLLKKLTQELANASEERDDAAGISYVKNNKVTIYKRPKPAHKLKFTFPEDTRAVMGHTRLTTREIKYNWNNHPFHARLRRNLHLLITEYFIMILSFVKKKSCRLLVLRRTAMLQFS